MKQVGWIVKWITDSGRIWETFRDDVASTRSYAIILFNNRCQFYFLNRQTIKNKTQYRSLRRRGLAKCVKVYIEEEPTP